MKTRIALLATIFTLNFSFAQLGVNTTDPKATLDVVGKVTDTEAVDGIIPPRITLAELNAKTNYTADQTGATVYITDVTGSTVTATTNITGLGFYFFDGTNWIAATGNIVGDIKSGIQTTDHNGWVKLDGRAISGLTTTQQANATAMGLSGNLPNASNSYLSQNGRTLGSVYGNNYEYIEQEQLPNIKYDGDFSTYGGQFTSRSGVFTSYDSGQRRQGEATSTIAGGINFNLYLNGNVTQQKLYVTPQTLSVNMFVYLGN